MTRVSVLLLSTVAFLVFAISTVSAQQTVNSQQNDSSQMANNGTTEGTVVSVSRGSFVLRTDDGQFQVFRFGEGVVRPRTLAAGTRVRVTAGTAVDDDGSREATDIAVVTGGETRDKGAEAAPVPAKVRDIESDIKRESRRWRLGVRAGAALDPELFTFGVQSQIGPILHPRFLFRPNAEFAFGEVTDLIALNLEGIYRFSPKQRRGNWTPYLGAGPALNFIHQSYSQGRDINFGNFDYETGFNVLAGMQSRRGTFVELKTSLWSGPAPKLRLIVGYNF